MFASKSAIPAPHESGYFPGHDIRTTTFQSLTRPNGEQSPNLQPLVDSMSRMNSSGPEPMPERLPFRFVDELARKQSPRLQRDVRSHARKESHFRRRKLNGVSEPRVKGNNTRPLLVRKGESSQDSSTDSVYKVRKPSPTGSGTKSASPSEEPDVTLAYECPAGSQQSPTANDLAHLKAKGFKLEDAEHGQLTLSRMDVNKLIPYAFILGGSAPFLQVDRGKLPYVRPVDGRYPVLCSWMPNTTVTIPDAKSPRPCLLKNAKTLPWLSESSEYFEFKDEVIMWVNNRLGDAKYATNEKTVGAMLSLMSWEATRGNIAELVLHMDGLTRILTLGGGLDKFEFINQFCWKIRLIDLLVAMLTNTQPRFHLFKSTRPAPPPTQNPSLGAPQVADSPLCGTDLFGPLLAKSAFCKSGVTLLNYARALTNAPWDGEQYFTQEKMPSKTRKQHADASAASLYEVIYWTTKIYKGAFDESPTPFSSKSNVAAVRKICTGLEDVSNDGTWTQYPGILLWVLLTATSAAIYLPQRNFLVMFLTRLGVSATWWGIEDADGSMRKFMLIKLRADKAPSSSGSSFGASSPSEFSFEGNSS